MGRNSAYAGEIWKISLTNFLLIVSSSFYLMVSNLAYSAENLKMSKRVPAEWEQQESIWLQWPRSYEKSYEVAFAKIATIIPTYELLNIVYHSDAIREQAKSAIRESGGNPDHQNIAWFYIPNDSAWMRDTGPLYVIENGELRIQNWEFDAWGGAFGEEVTFANDNLVPDRVGEILNLPVDKINIVHERGNLEFNGVDTVILNWSTIGDPNRNPGYSKDQATKDLKTHFGVSKVVFIEGVVEGDLTRGHIDGIARFINPTTVVVPECTQTSLCKPGISNTSSVYDSAARVIEKAGFSVIRDPINGHVSYRGYQFDVNYMNWLVGNGFVLTVGFGDEELDQAAKVRIENYFPEREVYVVEMLDSWIAGGGVHCHTNDQPALLATGQLSTLGNSQALVSSGRVSNSHSESTKFIDSTASRVLPLPLQLPEFGEVNTAL